MAAPADALPTSLMLLFNGLKPEAIAKALVAALGTDDSIRLEVELTKQRPIAVYVATDKFEILETIDDDDCEFVGTEEQLKLILQTLSFDAGDTNMHLRDAAIDALRDHGLIRDK